MAMTRNSESRFATNPVNMDIRRSRFDRSNGLKTTFNTSQLIPIYVDEVLPGDTFRMDMACIIRMSTPIFPVMDNADADIYFFFVPNRLTWEHWKEFNGENTEYKWTQEVIYEIPQLKAPAEGFGELTLHDYFGLPTKVPLIEVSHLPYRAYCLIWNEWFRDENLQDPVYIFKGDSTLNGINTMPDEKQYAQLGGMPLTVNKHHDYFTSALPEPQKGPAIKLPVSGDIPVFSSDSLHNLSNAGMKFKPTPSITNTNRYPVSIANRSNSSPNEPFDNIYVETTGTSFSGTGNHNLVPNNLWAAASETLAITINEMRSAFQIQKLFERDARGGSRYIELIKSHFGVTSPDARQQRPEYLGGHRFPINVDQVLQTSSTNEVSPQGNTAAYSLTGIRQSLFTKSFTEHGLVIGLICVRTKHTYQQGIERMWSRKKRFEYYWPALANIGEQAILNKELYAQGPLVGNGDEEAFGYQEAWADYRYKPSRVTGSFRSNYHTTLDSWHYADNYNAQPFLSDGWIRETKNNMDRTLAVTSSVEPQFIADMYFRNISTRPMPVYSIPGLIDHF